VDDGLDDILLIKGSTGSDEVPQGRPASDSGGEATKITDILRKKGELQIHDADGNPMK
jgi:hypothetical protein